MYIVCLYISVYYSLPLVNYLVYSWIRSIKNNELSTALPVKSDSDVMFCLQHYQGLIIDRSLVY